MLAKRHHRLVWVAAIAAIALLAATVAVGAPTEVRTFAPAGDGEGGIGPHASALAVAPDGTIFVADYHEGRVEVYSNDGTPARAFGDLDGPTALILHGDRLFVGDANGVHAFSVANGDHLKSYGGPASPLGIAVGPGGTIYASDAADGEVAVIDGASIGDEHLVSPAGMAVGPGGDLFVSDPGTDTVKRFSATGELRDGWPADDPHGLAFAPDGTLYVAESQNHRVGHFLVDGVRIEDLGGSLNVPRGVAVDCRGSVYVLDNSNPRGHVFAEPGTAAPPCLVPPPPPAQEVQAAVQEAEPEVGRTARATVLRGAVVVGKGNARRQLRGRAILPIGEQIDVANGLVRLEFEAIGPDREKYGRLMDAEFDSGEFTIHQARDNSLVEVVLAGASGQQARTSSGAQAAATRKRRRVWTRARGRFRTRGNHGAATVQGTQWLTEERERGTYFRVTEGSIAIKVFRSGRTKVITAPDSFLARKPCVSRRRFRIRLRPPVGTTVRSVSVRMDGRRIPVREGRRLTALIDLRGRPKGRVVVRITVRTTDGRVVRGVRDYHTCRRQQRGDVPEL